MRRPDNSSGRNATVTERAPSGKNAAVNKRVSVLKSSLRNHRGSARVNTSAEWETAEGGGVRAVGVGGGVTGFGAGLIVIDDPVKSRAEAESPAYRERRPGIGSMTICIRGSSRMRR